MSAIGLKQVVGGVTKAYRAARMEPVGYRKCRHQPKKEKLWALTKSQKWQADWLIKKMKLAFFKSYAVYII